MFVDLVGSTALAARLDPEDMREVHPRLPARASRTRSRRFEGFVAKFMGDGVLAYFGWPQAHEDDAERAVRAGLAIVEAVGRLSRRPASRSPRASASPPAWPWSATCSATGAAREQAVVGETPNLAARLQALAEPGAVVIDDGDTAALGGLFELRELGAVD